MKTTTTTTTVAFLLATFALAHVARAGVINVDFGAGQGPSAKTGPAVTGIGPGDYWNYYTRDNPDNSWKVNGSLDDLKYAGGQPSPVDMTVNNGDGAWSYAASDPMLAQYIYSLSGGVLQTQVTLTNLPAGTYNFYLYGADSQFNLTVGATDYGTKISYDYPVIDPPPWVEGRQYVSFTNVPVAASQSALIALGPGQGYYQGIIGGMQIEMIPEPASGGLLLLLLLLPGGSFLLRRQRERDAVQV